MTDRRETKMQLYTIVPLLENNVDAVCEDIREQYEKGVATCALFSMTLHPEGTPPAKKAEAFSAKYLKFKEKLDALGVKNGILVQATIGHGRPLAAPTAFTKYYGITESEESTTCCPYDESFCLHMRDVFRTLASTHPDSIMVDDDFRLIARKGNGCACRLHMAEFNKRAETNFTKEDLYRELCRDGSGKYAKIFIEIQGDALLRAARAMRAGIDDVDPTIPGTYCGCGANMEFAEDIARILAGKGNPTVVRINNGNYTPAGARYLSRVSFKAANQAERIRGKVDFILAETDTCPQNRYSTGAMTLHSNFVASILEGANGAKHWITRLTSLELNSGKAYRKILSSKKGMYEALSAIVPDIRWFGCRLPLTSNRYFCFNGTNWSTADGMEGWAQCVLERFGIPLYFSSQKGGAVFLSSIADKKFTDDEILEMLKGVVFLSSDTAKSLIDRGFSEYLGVDVREWSGLRPTTEVIGLNGNSCSVQVGFKELVPKGEGVKSESIVYHTLDRVNYTELFPGVTSFKNSLGGSVVVFCGTPVTEFNYLKAFSFLNESRKAQIVDLLTRFGQLPVYYPSDEEVYIKAGRLSDSSLFVCLFNIGLDPIDELELVTSEDVKDVQILSSDGEWESTPFTKEGNRLFICHAANTLDPVVIILRK